MHCSAVCLSIISVLLGEDSTWQWLHAWLQYKPMLIWNWFTDFFFRTLSVTENQVQLLCAKVWLCDFFLFCKTLVKTGKNKYIFNLPTSLFYSEVNLLVFYCLCIIRSYKSLDVSDSVPSIYNTSKLCLILSFKITCLAFLLSLLQPKMFKLWHPQVIKGPLSFLPFLSCQFGLTKFTKILCGYLEFFRGFHFLQCIWYERSLKSL